MSLNVFLILVNSQWMSFNVFQCRSSAVEVAGGRLKSAGGEKIFGQLKNFPRLRQGHKKSVEIGKCLEMSYNVC